jgi:beta-glucosidase
MHKIAVLGPNADNKTSVLGNYNGTPSEIVTALQGIKNKLGNAVEVVYEKAVNFTNDSVKTQNGPVTDFIALVNRLKDVDAIIFVGGISPQLEGEEMKVTYPGFKGGDRTSIMLPHIQTELMKALQQTGKPVIFVMMTGSAIAIPWENEHIPAIINAWYGGQAAGTAIADVLFGDYNPAGRLPVTFYADDNDLPAFDDYSMSNRTYRYFKGKPLYGFGYGLSYTTFKYGQLKISAPSAAGTVRVSVRVTNTGKRDGEEVVQLYLSGENSKSQEPIQALKGFQRIFLKAGIGKRVQFALTKHDLSTMDENGNEILLPGKKYISVGGGQPGINNAKGTY